MSDEETAWRKAIADQVRANCTPDWEAVKKGGDTLIQAVCDWIENPPEWSAFHTPELAAVVSRDTSDVERVTSIATEYDSCQCGCGKEIEPGEYMTFVGNGGPFLAIHLKPVRASVTPPTREVIAEAISEVLRDTVYSCSRVWEAWQYNTMTPDDFSPAWEDEEVLDSAAAAVLVLFAAPPTESEGK